METANMGNSNENANQKIDWHDIRVGLLIGCLVVVVKVIKHFMPGLQLGNLDGLVAFFLCVQYTIYRARQEPEKLDEWGITTPITRSALMIITLATSCAIAVLAACSLLLTDTLSFEIRYISKMVEYIISAFPQQFFMCSVGLVTLSKFPLLKGLWRLPFVVGLLFALAHFWVPFHFPGTKIPLQVIVTFPMGFFAAWYFLKFRNILPLTVSHAILYVLLHHWVEVQL